MRAGGDAAVFLWRNASERRAKNRIATPCGSTVGRVVAISASHRCDHPRSARHHTACLRRILRHAMSTETLVTMLIAWGYVLGMLIYPFLLTPPP